MIASINAIGFVRAIECKKSEKYISGFKPNTKINGNYIWESGLCIKTEYPNELIIVLDGNLKPVETWVTNDEFDVLGISGLKIGKTTLKPKSSI